MKLRSVACAAALGLVAPLVVVPTMGLAAPVRQSLVAAGTSISALPLPASVAIGGRVTVKGSLRTTKPVGGRQVFLVRRDQGSSTWKTLARVSVAWNGTYQFGAVSVTRNAAFQVQFRGGAGYPAARTTPRSVAVAVRLNSVRTSPSVPIAGSPITVTASTSPHLAGQRVLLQRRAYGTYWENLSAVTVGRSGSISAMLRQSDAGRQDYRFELVAAPSHPRAVASVPAFTVFKWFRLAEYESLYTKTIAGQFHASAPGWELGGVNGSYAEHNISLAGKCREFRSTVGIWDGHADRGLAAQFVLLTPSGARAVSGSVAEGTAVAVRADVRGWSRIGMRTVKRAPEALVGTAAWGSPIALCSQEPKYLGNSFGG